MLPPQELKATPYFLLWLRYTTFYVLYPLGVGSELAMAYHARPTIRTKSLWKVSMPNPYNFAFDYDVFCLLMVAIYPLGFYTLYNHMISQRGKKLAEVSSGASKQKAE